MAELEVAKRNQGSKKAAAMTETTPSPLSASQTLRLTRVEQDPRLAKGRLANAFRMGWKLTRPNSMTEDQRQLRHREQTTGN
jgi:hypothetical protein